MSVSIIANIIYRYEANDHNHGPSVIHRDICNFLQTKNAIVNTPSDLLDPLSSSKRPTYDSTTFAHPLPPPFTSSTPSSCLHNNPFHYPQFPFQHLHYGRRVRKGSALEEGTSEMQTRRELASTECMTDITSEIIAKMEFLGQESQKNKTIATKDISCQTSNVRSPIKESRDISCQTRNVSGPAKASRDISCQTSNVSGPTKEISCQTENIRCQIKNVNCQAQISPITMDPQKSINEGTQTSPFFSQVVSKQTLNHKQMVSISHPSHANPCRDNRCPTVTILPHNPSSYLSTSHHSAQISPDFPSLVEVDHPGLQIIQSLGKRDWGGMTSLSIIDSPMNSMDGDLERGLRGDFEEVIEVQVEHVDERDDDAVSNMIERFERVRGRQIESGIENEKPIEGTMDKKVGNRLDAASGSVDSVNRGDSFGKRDDGIASKLSALADGVSYVGTYQALGTSEPGIRCGAMSSKKEVIFNTFPSMLGLERPGEIKRRITRTEFGTILEEAEVIDVGEKIEIQTNSIEPIKLLTLPTAVEESEEIVRKSTLSPRMTSLPSMDKKELDLLMNRRESNTSVGSSGSSLYNTESILLSPRLPTGLVSSETSHIQRRSSGSFGSHSKDVMEARNAMTIAQNALKTLDSLAGM